MDGASNALPPGLAEAGQAALEEFLPVVERKTPEHRKELGFSSEDDISQIKLGEPFEPRVLDPDSIQGCSNGQKLADLLSGSHRWYFPLYSTGHMACFITVAQANTGSWVPDSIGMAELAHSWSAVCEAWPPGKGYTPVLIFDPSHRLFLFSIPQAPYPNLTRLGVAAAETKAKTLGDLEKEEDTIAQLRTQTPPNR